MRKLLNTTATLATVTLMAASAQAQTAYMSFFDGKTTLQNAGTLPNLPTSSPYALFYAVYRSNSALNINNANPLPPLISGWQGKNTSLRFYFAVENDATCGGDRVFFSLGPVAPAGTNTSPILGVFPTDPANIKIMCIPHAGYHTILAGINTRGTITPHTDGTQSQTVIKALVDGQLANASIYAYPGQGQLAPYDIAWNQMVWQKGTMPSTKTVQGGAWSGDLATGLWVPPASYGFIDPVSVAANFLDSEGGPLPFQDMGSTGEGYIPGLKPQIWFSGGPVLAPFAQRSSGKNWASGYAAGMMVMDAATDPAYFKTIAGGLIRSNAPDPF